MLGKGIVFDIQRFSLHDGPGIRTTVFLKGCPLKCLWCHNPESWYLDTELLYREDKCQNCMACVKVCPVGCHKIVNGKHCLDRSLCIACGKCVDACIYSALRLMGKKMDAKEVIKEVMKDMPYYDSSNGGITISGGEPTLQFEFTLELLKRAKEQGIHTCIETSGMAPIGKIKELVKYTDLFLFDIKETDTLKHKKFTGTGNEIILQNLDYIYSTGTEIILRCPFIPGLNDGGEEIRGIVELLNKYPNIKSAEILPYHDLGKSKWRELDRSEPLYNIKKFEDYEINCILNKFKIYGCNKVKLS